MDDHGAALIRCWREIADSIVEHDVEHERRAWAELHRLIPEQIDRESE